jgi:hypothetical protein
LIQTIQKDLIFCFVFFLVGIALIGGILACVNRRGGCTKKRNTKKSDFEDYGLGDFPHQRTTPAAAVPVVANNGKPVSPTIPRLNDQGNYYNDDGYNHYNNTGYADNGMDYGMQQQQQQQQHGGYYYPQQQQEYYDDGGYYYDSNTSATAYSSVPPMQQHMHAGGVAGQQGYVMNNTIPQQQQDIYKPDDIGSPTSHHQGGGNVPHNR